MSEQGRHTGGWRVTAAQVRAAALGGMGALAAVVGHRPDLLVLVTPLLVVAVWGRLTRPHQPIAGSARVGNRTLVEGEATTWTARLELPAGVDETLVRLSPGQFVTLDPLARGHAVEPGPDRRAESRIVARVTRWGVRRIGPGLVASRSAWWAYRTPILEFGAFTVTAVPATAGFRSDAATPHPEGLVGINRSARPGTGSEFATIRPFQPGDRLRRVHWPSSLRSGRLQVTTSHADEDAHVVLVVDAFSDLGPREGIDGRATSLDLTVRATAALAQHHARTGDRVSLRVLGSPARRLATGSGPAQHRRVLDVLARITPASDRDLETVRALEGLVSGSLVVVFTPLVHPAMAGVVAGVAARGMAVVVVDTMPEHLWTDVTDPHAALAWRIRRLDRADELDRLRGAGVPVVTWHGPGSLDLVLRDLSRRARGPRPARR